MAPGGGRIRLFGFQVFTLYPAPSIATAGGISARTCLIPPQGGGVSARADRRGDAPEQAGHGGFFWFVFFPLKENEHIYQINTLDRSNLPGSSTRGRRFRSKLTVIFAAALKNRDLSPDREGG